MVKEIPVETIQRLADASEKAGLSFEDVLCLLRTGVTIEKLLAALEMRLIQHGTPSGKFV